MDIPQDKTRQAVSAAVIGNVLEWYDFAVYGYVATIIAKNFFPPGNETAALLATFAAFGIGFLARPLGGIVIGWVGDTYGRKTALLITIFLMAARHRHHRPDPDLCERSGCSRRRSWCSRG